MRPRRAPGVSDGSRTRGKVFRDRGDAYLRVLKRIWSVFTTVIVAAAVILALGLVGMRLLGFQIFTILSGSMEPTYHVGSLILVRPTDPQEIRVGDPITFVMNEDLLVATHRVIGIDAEEDDGMLRFATQGDANATPDALLVHQNNVIGVPILNIPKLGFVIDYIREPPGTYAAIAIGAAVLLLLFLPDMIRVLAGDDAKKPEKSKTGKAPKHKA